MHGGTTCTGPLRSPDNRPRAAAPSLPEFLLGPVHATLCLASRTQSRFLLLPLQVRILGEVPSPAHQFLAGLHSLRMHLAFLRASLKVKHRAHNPAFQVRLLGAQPFYDDPNIASTLRQQHQSAACVQSLVPIDGQDCVKQIFVVWSWDDHTSSGVSSNLTTEAICVTQFGRVLEPVHKQVGFKRHQTT